MIEYPPVGKKLLQVTTHNDPNSINLGSVYTNSAINQWANMSHKWNSCYEFMLFDEMTSYLANSFIEAENNDLNFYEFIINCKAISHKSI